MPAGKKVFPVLKRIALTGPESSGKTWLCEALAKRFGCFSVPEMARLVLEKDGGSYDEEKVEVMARMQAEEEERLAALADQAGHSFLFCDTNLLVYQVWMETRFGRCPSWIQHSVQQPAYHFQFLLRPDLPWEEDPLRENPLDRDRLFLRYHSLLAASGANWSIIEGQSRLEDAVKIIEQFR